MQSSSTYNAPMLKIRYFFIPIEFRYVKLKKPTI